MSSDKSNPLLAALSVCESMVGSDNSFRGLSIVPRRGGLACRLSRDERPAPRSLAHTTLRHRRPVAAERCPAGLVDVGRGRCAPQPLIDQVVDFCERQHPIDPGCFAGPGTVMLTDSCVRTLRRHQGCIDDTLRG